MYAKLKDGNFVEAPRKLEINGNWVWNAPSEAYLAQGWKAVRFTDEPEPIEGYYWQSGWTETETEIVQTWTQEPLPDDVDEAEAFDIIFGGEA